FILARCTPNDVPQMVSVYLSAFIDTKFNWWWSPTLDAMRRWTERRFVGKFAEPSAHHFKVVDTETGKLIAWSRWNVPKDMKGMAVGFQTYGEETKEDLGIPEGADERLHHEFFDGIHRMSAKWRASEKLGLSVLCTDPAYHRRGAAKALIGAVLPIADAEGCTTYLEALENATAVYELYGFKTVDELEYDLTKAGREGKARINIMLREP
ncbi:acyl-CoA N-acyltransferase, partial [Pseudomassariella vexata]